jgi:NADH dehydrogenase
MAITSQMIYARLAMSRAEAQRRDALAAAEQAEHAEQDASTGDAAREATPKRAEAG